MLVPEYPKHLIIKELKRAQNNTILALCYIVNEITNARNKHGTESICEDQDEKEVDDTIHFDGNKMKKRKENVQKFVYILNKNWFENGQWIRTKYEGWYNQLNSI